MTDGEASVGGLVVRPLTGAAATMRLDDLARLRIAVFRDFPYLYAGSEDYERRYLALYAETEGSVIVGAFDGERLVGAATGVPLAGEPDALKAPLVDAGYDPERVFYFGESVLMPEYRGRGVGVAFFAAREAHARRLGRFDHACFCAVIRPETHPRRPAGYVPLDAFWRRRGFRPLDGAIGHIAWQDLDEAGETDKPMQFWIRNLHT